MFRGLVEGFIMALFWFATLLFLVIAPAVAFGPDFESRYYPVLEDVRIEKVSYEELPKAIAFQYDKDEYNWYELHLEKVRDCKPLKGTFAWYLVNSKGESNRVDMYDTSSDSLTLGENKVYVYVENKDEYFKSQRFVVTHRCHPLWPTRTNLNIDVSSTSLNK